MALWGLDKKPTFAANAVSRNAGWIDPVTNEVLVAIRQLSTKRRDSIERPQANLLFETGGLLLIGREEDDRPVFLLL